MGCAGTACALSSLGDFGRWAGGFSLSLPPSLSSSLYFYSLKLECEKLATEKTEIQRHYVMVSELHLKGEGRRGVSPLNHQRTHSPGDALASLRVGCVVGL